MRKTLADQTTSVEAAANELGATTKAVSELGVGIVVCSDVVVTAHYS